MGGLPIGPFNANNSRRRFRNGLLAMVDQQKRLKHELFDRRYEQFEIVRDFIKSIFDAERSTRDERRKFVMGTRGMRFIFDEELAQYVTASMYEPVVDLENLENMSSPENAKTRGDIKKQLYRELEGLEERFSKYLQLRD